MRNGKKLTNNFKIFIQTRYLHYKNLNQLLKNFSNTGEKKIVGDMILANKIVALLNWNNVSMNIWERNRTYGYMFETFGYM